MHASGKRKSLIFNLQKHKASRLHYDFRLEIEGVLKSWAIPKGPSMDPSVKRLAVEVEDHALGYADFEGIIGEQRYGSGLVLVWDTGWFEPVLEGGISAEAVVRTGALDLILHGHRLRGRFSLVKIKGKPRDWLLIKRKDADALPGVDITEKYQTSVLTGRSLKDMELEAKKGTLKTHHCE